MPPKKAQGTPAAEPQGKAKAPKRAAEEAFEDEGVDEDDEMLLTEGEKKQTRRQKKHKGGGPRMRPQRRMSDDYVQPDTHRHTTVHSEATRNGKSTADIFAERDTADLRKLQTAINMVEAETYVQRTESEMDAKHETISALFKKPAKPGRNWQVDFRKVSAGRSTQTRDNWAFGATDGSAYRFLGKTSVDSYDEAFARQVNGALVNLLNAWPGATFDAMSAAEIPWPLKITKVQASCIRAAEISVDPNMALHLQRATYKDKPLLTAGCQILCKPLVIDPKTYEQYPVEFSINPTKLTVVKDVRLPSNVRFLEGQKKGELVGTTVDPVTGKVTHGNLIPAELGKYEVHREKIEAAQKLGEALTVAAHNKIVSKEEFKAWAQAWLEEHTEATKPGTSASVYPAPGPASARTSQVCRVSRVIAKRLTSILPSYAVERDVKGKLPILSIPTLDRARTIIIIDTIVNTFLRTGNIKEAWLAGAHATIRVRREIEAGIPSPVRCTCRGNMQSTTKHCCGSCGIFFPCLSLMMGMYGLRVCPVCLAKEHGENVVPFPATVWTSLLGKNLRSEAQTIGLPLDGPIQTADVKAGEDFIKSQFRNDDNCKGPAGEPTTKWQDAYTQDYRAIAADRRFTPDNLSCEAVYPYNRSSNDRVRIHAASNIASIALGLNYCKHIQLPAWLHILSCYLAKLDDLKEAHKDQADILAKELLAAKLALIKASKQLRQVRLKAGYTRVARVGKKGARKVPNEKLELDLEEWRAGKLRPEDRDESLPWNQSRIVSGEGWAKSWPTDDIARVKALTDEIEKEFGVALQKSTRGGCPWIGLPGTMPNDWSWAAAAAFSAARYERMRENCNGLDDTVDEPEDIFVIIILIHCIILCVVRDEDKEGVFTPEQKRKLKARYGEFLDLPFVGDTFDALCISVAHAEHGMQMLTGFKRNARSLTDWVEKRNNLLVETRTSNFLKSDFAKEDYERLRSLAREVNIPKSLYDRTIKLEEAPVDLRDDLSGISEAEAWQFEEFITPAGRDQDFDGGALSVETTADDAADTGDAGDAGDAGENVENQFHLRYNQLVDLVYVQFPDRVEDPKINNAFAELEKAENVKDGDAFGRWDAELLRLLG